MSCKRTEEATLAHFMGRFVSFLTSKVRKMSKTMAHISPVASVKCQKTSFLYLDWVTQTSCPKSSFSLSYQGQVNIWIKCHKNQTLRSSKLPSQISFFKNAF